MGGIFPALRQLRPFQPPPISSPSPPLLRLPLLRPPPLLRQRPLSHTMAQPTLFSLPRCGIATYRQFFNLCSPTRTSTRTLLTSHNQTLPRYQCQRQQQQQQQQQQRIPSQSLINNRQRKYHSRHHLKDPHEYTNSQTTILSAALAHVPRHGFTHEALTLGARDAGFLDVSVQLLPRGEFDLVLFWLASRRGLLRDVAAEKFTEGTSMSSEEKVRMLVLERLWLNKGIREEWQGALALMSLAGNIPISLSELHALASDILSLAGDTSVDVSWYTKRMSVAAVYASAEVFMTHDESPNFAETEAFVQRRLEDTSAIGEKLGGMKQCLGFMGSTAVGLGRSWGLKI